MLNFHTEILSFILLLNDRLLNFTLVQNYSNLAIKFVAPSKALCGTKILHLRTVAITLNRIVCRLATSQGFIRGVYLISHSIVKKFAHCRLTIPLSTPVFVKAIDIEVLCVLPIYTFIKFKKVQFCFPSVSQCCLLLCRFVRRSVRELFSTPDTQYQMHSQKISS